MITEIDFNWLIGKFEKHYSVQRISEKALVLQDECLPKGTRPTLIFTLPFSNQFKLKESQNRVFFPPILADYWT